MLFRSSALVSDGSHAWAARAYDSSGNNVPSAPVSVTVNNTVSVTPLTISITSPTNLQLVNRRATLTLSATTSITSGVSVQFFVDGGLVCSDSVAPFSCDWKLLGTPNRTYAITAVATDSLGHTASSQPVKIGSSSSIK